jgi:DNA-binding transcriptional LysR family regulator
MEIRHLRYFVAVAEEQNVTRAAARLHVSQPPLSRQMRDLEEELGVALFERSAKALRLTEAGRTMLTEARAVLQRLAEAIRAVREVARGEGGELQVGYAPSLTVELLPEALRTLRERAPGVHVTLHDLSTEGMLAGLRDGSLHLALLVQPPPGALPGLRFDPLRSYPVCVAVPRAHELARARQVNLQRLGRERLIIYGRAEYPEYRAWIERLFLPVGPAPQVAEEHDSATSLIAAVEAGRGIALVPSSLACLAGPRLKLRPIAPPPPPLVVGVARQAGELPAAAARLVAALIGPGARPES